MRKFVDIRPLLSEQQIQKRVKELAQKIRQDYQGKELVVVGYGMDRDGRYRHLPFIGVVASPENGS